MWHYIMAPREKEAHQGPDTLGRRVHGSTIVVRSVWQGGIFAVAAVVVHRLVQAVGLDSQERVELTPTVIAVWASREGSVKGQSSLVQDEVDVRGGCAGRVVDRTCATVSVDRMRCLDQLDVETSAERLKVRDDQVVRDHVRLGEEFGELSEPKCGQNRHDVG